jgi:hypothetical protein
MDLLPDKSLLPILNLDIELYKRNNVPVAFLVLIAGLIKNIEQQQKILERVKPEYINVPFHRYLYEVVIDELARNQKINVTSIINRIPDFGPLVYGTPTEEGFLKANYYTFAQVLGFQPTSIQISKAIDMVVGYAKKRGKVS